ncbi:MAG: Tad domain-containing protein [Bdellovibrionaceae bacterium]|nr:Tad domain-containing protein [Pseudobdellovibrionaceae bacterium]
MRQLRSNKGQIAIFLVLVFQILFVFFAMSINVGLVVYDKINLQNSTDLAAYYAASKQAEMLNEIAHINYQMRQAYKLLTYRLRVIGSASIGIGPESRLKKHPIFLHPNLGQETDSFFDRLGEGRHAPGVCIGSSMWREYQITEANATVSLCQNLDSFSAVPPASGGGDPFGFTDSLNQYLDRVRGEIEEKCKVVGVLNWQLSASWFLAYIYEATKRSEMIDQMANQLSQPATQMTDFIGQSVYQGSLQTLRKNLTEPQRQTASMTLKNSLSSDVPGNCSTRDFWLPKIEIYPVVTYVSMIWSGFTCTTKILPSRSAENVPPAAYLALVGGRNNGVLQNVWSSGNSVPYGVEKNPWCMPYMSIKATSQPRKIFSPFGQPAVLQAEAIAKPFGGRVGPWYSSQWPSGSATSQGSQMVDPLLPARNISGARAGGNPADDLVNHSKYPGDKLGMNSSYALGTMSDYFTNNVTHNANLNTLPPVFALGHYNHVGDPPLFDSQADSLARTNSSDISGDSIRLMEETSVIPDLFDITYYSIEGQYSYNFANPTQPQFSSFVNPHFHDIGSSNRAPYSIVTQLERSKTVYTQRPFYSVAHPDHLLTGWSQNKAVNYEFPEKFGKCDLRRDGDMENAPGPGGCPHGGRSGYSVKIVSKSYLKKVDADLGGPGNSGAILNAPE